MMKKPLLAVLIACCAHAWAIDPKMFPDHPTESLSVNVVIPVPDKPQAVTLRPLLIKPASPAPWSAIVLPSNCSGLDDRMWHFWVKELIAKNIAVILLDSFNPRGFPSICQNQFLLTTGARLQDVHQVLDVLRRDPRFIPDKIALGGHSAGAATTYQSAYAEVLALLKRPPQSGYNAFVSAAPACTLIYKSKTLLGPLLFVGAEKDDWTPVAPCVRELEQTKAQGQPVQIKIVPNAYHTFSTHSVMYSSRVMKAPVDAPQGYIKTLSYLPRQTLVELPTGEVFKMDELIKKYSGFMGSKIFGATVGGQWDQAPLAATWTADFLKENGW
jgi:dienelactone hydrolase